MLAGAKGDARSKSVVVEGGRSAGRGPGAPGAGLLGGCVLPVLADLTVLAGDDGSGSTADPRLDGGTGKS